jgi:serine/threonine protein kinase
MEIKKLQYLYSTKGYKIATENMSQQEIEQFEEEYLTLSPLMHAGIAGNYIIGTDNNLSKFYLTIDCISQVFLLNEKRNAQLFGLTYFSKTHRFLVLHYLDGGKLREKRITLNQETDDNAIQKFVITLKNKNPNIKLAKS